MASLIFVVKAKIKSARHSRSSASTTMRKAQNFLSFAYKTCCLSLGKLVFPLGSVIHLLPPAIYSYTNSHYCLLLASKSAELQAQELNGSLHGIGIIGNFFLHWMLLVALTAWALM